MAFDALTKVSRLVNGQRYTSTDLGASQEAYASSIQMASNEVWSQASLIPSSSLPFSSSASPNTILSSSILNYWYKYPLTVANNTLTGSSVWYFIYPSGSISGVGSQLIQNGQQTNFISSKYAIPSLSGNDADASSNGIIPGYNIALFSSPDNTVFTTVSPNTYAYQFDYKTGVLEFTTLTIPTNRIYATVYQYNGQFLSDTISNISGSLSLVSSCSWSSASISSSYLNPGATFYQVSGSNGVQPAYIEPYDYCPSSNNYLPPYKPGRMWYDNRYIDWAYYPNTGSNATSFRLHLGKEVTIGVHNPYSVTLPRLSAVYIGTSSVAGQYQPDVYLAIADGTGLHANVEGIIRNDIPSGSNGFMLMNGVMHRTNMGSLTLGQQMWLSTSSFGGYQTTEPAQPYEQVLLGYCSETGSLGSFICSINNLPPPINAYAGLVSNITITNNNDGTITLSTGSVNLYNNSQGTGLVYTYSLPQTTLTLTTGSSNYIVAIQSGKVGQYTNISNRLLIDSITVIPVTVITPIYLGPGNWKFVEFDFNPYGLALADKITLKDTYVNNFQRQDGLTLFLTGSSNDFGITTGNVWFGVVLNSLGQYQSSITSSCYTFHYAQSASIWSYTTQSGFDNGNYNGTGGFVPLTANSWSVNFIYRLVEDDTDAAIILSNQQYDNLLDAETAQPPASLPQMVSDYGLLVGRLVVQSGSLSPTIQSAYTSIFATSVVTQHNSLLGLQGGTSGQYYHLTSGEYTGTGTGNFVRATGGTITATGSLFGTSSNAVSSSYANTASYAPPIYQTSGSWASSSISSSYSTISSTSSYVTSSNIVGTVATSSWAINAISASYAISSSYSKNTDTASAIYNTSSFVSSSYAVLFTSASGVQAVYFDDQNAFTYNPGTDVLAVPSISASTSIYTVDPTVYNQVATKNYVDQINPQGFDYYFRSASADIAGYEYMFRLTQPLSASNQTIVQTAVSASQVFMTFVSPALNIPNISQGQYNVHFHLYRVGGNAANAIHPELYIRSGSTEYIFLGAGSVSTITTTITDYFTIPVTVTSSVALNLTDRLVCHFVCNNGTATPDMHMIVDGQTGAGVNVPVPSSTFVLRSGDTMTGGLTAPSFTGSLQGTASNAISASWASLAVSASYITASNIVGTVTNSLTASYITTAQTASYVTTAQTASFITSSNIVGTVANALTASFVTASNISGYVTNAFTASYITSSNIVGNIVATASWASNAITSNTASYITASNVSGYVTNAFTASFITASNVNGSVTNAFTASFVTTAQTASFVTTANTASYVSTAQTASYFNEQATFLTTGSTYQITSSYAVSASWSPGSAGGTTLVTASTYQITSSWASNAVSSSYAMSASWSPGSAGGTTLFTGSTYQITSSLAITASFALTTVYVNLVGGDPYGNFGGISVSPIVAGGP